MTDLEPTARARQLADDMAHLHGVIKGRKEALRAAGDQALQVTAEATSPDGSVHATVDAGGMLIELELAPDVALDQLATEITAVVQQAAGNARAAVQQTYTRLQNEGVAGDMPVLLPAPTPPPSRPWRPDEDPSNEDATSMLDW